MELVLLIAVMTISSVAYAQDGQIVGVVYDEKGEPLFPANIILNHKTGTSSNPDGTFKLVVAPGDYTVSASMIGYLTKTKTVSVSAGSSSEIIFNLIESYDALDEVVVLGQRKKIVSATRSNMELIDIPMAVQLVDRDLIQQQQIINLRETFRNVSGIQNTSAWGNGSRRLSISARGFLLGK